MAKTLTLQEFVSRARQVHGNKYGYDKVVYRNAHTAIIVTCPKHGDFKQEPTNHIHNKRGCPICAYGGTDEERFFSFIDKNGKQIDYVCSRCWEWTGDKGQKGYGRFWVDTKSIPAHRYSYWFHFGDMPKNLCVLHSCDNPGCVNPNHLFLGTHQDNMTDKARKGRSPNQCGESNPSAKLKNEDVLEIRRLHNTGKYLQKELAIIFNSPLSSINQIITGKRWKHLTP